LPGSGGVSSWNDLTDKPFYTEMGEGVLYANSNLALTDGQAVINSIGLQPGKTYTVEEGVDSDGGTIQTYECVAQTLALGDGVAYVCIGDIGAVTGGDSTGEPFVILDASEQGVCMVMGVTGQFFLRNFKIIGEGEIIHPLDPAFVSDGLTKIIDFVGPSDDGEYVPFVCSRRFGEDDYVVLPSDPYLWQKMGYQVIGRIEVNGTAVLLQLSKVSVDEYCFTSVVADSAGVIVYSMRNLNSLLYLSIFDVTATTE